MKRLFSLSIGSCEQPYAGADFRYAGVLGAWQEQYLYARKTFDAEARSDVLVLYTIKADGTRISEERFFLPDTTCLAYLWRGYEMDGDFCIVMGQQWYFSVSQKTVLPFSDACLSRWLADTHADNMYFYTEASYAMPPYEIRHRGEQGYACFQDGNELWHRRVQGYLYTDMVRYNLYGEDAVVFGTDGAGGHFIALRLSDGEPILDIKTGGTDRYLYDGHRFYAHKLGRGGGLIAVTPNGETELCPLIGVVNTHLPLALCENTVLALSFTRKGDRYADVYVNAVDVSVETQTSQ